MSDQLNETNEVNETLHAGAETDTAVSESLADDVVAETATQETAAVAPDGEEVPQHSGARVTPAAGDEGAGDPSPTLGHAVAFPGRMWAHLRGTSAQTGD